MILVRLVGGALVAYGTADREDEVLYLRRGGSSFDFEPSGGQIALSSAPRGATRTTRSRAGHSSPRPTAAPPGRLLGRRRWRRSAVDGFQALGGVDALGYPVTRRFELDGFVVQAFQKSVLQWQPSRSVQFPEHVRRPARSRARRLAGVVSPDAPPLDTAPDKGLPWEALWRATWRCSMARRRR